MERKSALEILQGWHPAAKKGAAYWAMQHQWHVVRCVYMNASIGAAYVFNEGRQRQSVIPVAERNV